MQKEVTNLLELLYKEISDIKEVLDVREVDLGKKALILRSGNMALLQQCINDVKINTDVDELLVIGKSGDETGIEQVWDRKYTLISIEGNYSVDKINTYMNVISEFNADCNIYISYAENDQQYLNVYSIMAQMSKGNVYEYLINTYWNRMNNMKKYYRAMNLVVTLIEWYHGEVYE